MWAFFQDQILGMKWLNILIGKLLFAFGLDIDGKVGGTLQFFVYDTIKIVILLCSLISKGYQRIYLQHFWGL